MKSNILNTQNKNNFQFIYQGLNPTKKGVEILFKAPNYVFEFTHETLWTVGKINKNAKIERFMDAELSTEAEVFLDMQKESGTSYYLRSSLTLTAENGQQLTLMSVTLEPSRITFDDLVKMGDFLDTLKYQ